MVFAAQKLRTHPVIIEVDRGKREHLNQLRKVYPRVEKP